MDRVLRAEQRARDLGRVEKLQLRAAEWFEAAADTRRAARHFLAARQADRALALLLPASTYRQIAGTLHLSRNTVKAHLRSVDEKLGATSRSQALERAVDLRLL